MVWTGHGELRCFPAATDDYDGDDDEVDDDRAAFKQRSAVR